jgi:hypothetical protein
MLTNNSFILTEKFGNSTVTLRNSHESINIIAPHIQGEIWNLFTNVLGKRSPLLKKYKFQYSNIFISFLYDIKLVCNSTVYGLEKFSTHRKVFSMIVRACAGVNAVGLLCETRITKAAINSLNINMILDSVYMRERQEWRRSCL